MSNVLMGRLNVALGRNGGTGREYSRFWCLACTMLLSHYRNHAASEDVLSEAETMRGAIKQKSTRRLNTATE